MASVSVIIPIYNKTEYIEKCLESIANQTYKDFEVIMVDDGSTDDTSEKCKRFESKDSRFHYYYKSNGGVSSARNYGIKVASGEYISFIDADDFIESEYFEKLYKLTLNDSPDVVQCGMNLIRNGKITELTPYDNVWSGDEFRYQVLSRKFPVFLLQTTCTKIYKRKLIIDNNICFDEDVSHSEDCLFNTMLLPYINTIRTISYCGYNYIQDNSTLTKSKSSYKKTYQSIKVGRITAEIRNKMIKDMNLNNDSEIIKGFHTAICIIYISNAHEIELGGFSNEEKQSLYKSYFDVMNYSVDKAIDNYSGTDKQIILASVNKNYRKIEKIYKLRELKKKIFR